MSGAKSGKLFHSGSGNSTPCRGAYLDGSVNCIVGIYLGQLGKIARAFIRTMSCAPTVLVSN
jgi:hypothetical protein